jgi:antitoxin ParD1/3/4
MRHYNHLNHQLVREDPKRSSQKRLEALLLEGLDSGAPIEATEDWWKQKLTKLQDRLTTDPNRKNR